jgi:NADPH-dependent glutamate synthase beta subunit-like oxidoreductase/dihydroorotate dehydrogenase
MTVPEKYIFQPFSLREVYFRNPFIIASGPTTRNIRQLLRAEECGWGGASIKLTIAPTPYINREPRYGWFEKQGIFAFTAEKRLTPQEGLKLVEDARKQTSELVIMGNITYAGELTAEEGWGGLAKDFENAGAHAIELNMCCPNMSFNIELSDKSISQGPRTGASLGQDAQAVANITQIVKDRVSIPVFVKLTPEGGKIAEVAKACFEAGADVVGGTANRLAIPPFDIYNPGKSPFKLQKELSMTCYSGEWIKPLALRDVYEMRKLNGPKPIIVGAGGIRNFRDVVEMTLMGANLYAICTETIISGYSFLEKIIDDLRNYLEEMNCVSLQELCGLGVENLKSAATVTLDKGNAEVKDPALSAPCVAACPNYVPAQGYVMAVSKGDFRKAYDLILSSGPFQFVCAYACNHPCEPACVRGEIDDPINIKAIKRFVLDHGLKHSWHPDLTIEGDKDTKIAVLGAGPAGLSAAYYLRKVGYQVTIYERNENACGMLRYGIPRYRLPLDILDYEINLIQQMGVQIITGIALGKDFTLTQLKSDGFDRIIIAFGAQQNIPLIVPGINSKGVLNALEFLESVSCGKKPQIGKRIAVIGGGFSAFDAARSCKRLGCDDIYLLYRRTRDEMPASPIEINEAEEEGIKIMYLIFPKKIINKNGKVSGIQLVNHVLGGEDRSNRRKSIEVEGTEFNLQVDTVICALGQKVEEELDPGLVRIIANGIIKNNRGSCKTEIKDVYVAGDAATGAKDIISAVASGRRAAIAVDRSVSGRKATFQPMRSPNQVHKFEVLDRQSGIKRVTGIKSQKKQATERIKNFEIYTRTLSEEQAVAEASRCLNCGCGEGCLICVDVCNSFAIHAIGGLPLVDAEECVACGICVWRCPNANIEMITTPS